MNKSKSKLKPEIQARLSSVWNTELTPLAPTAQPVKGEAMAAVVLTEKTATLAELLSVGLTPAKLREQLGEPESISSQVLDTGDESRPVILTLYHYAGDAFVFAVPDISRTPGVVDRAFLNTQKISPLIFRP